MRIIGWLVAAVLVAATLPIEAARTKKQDEQSEQRIKRDIEYLASDECEGRGPNSAGIERAAAHVAAEFRRAGLKPGWRGEWYQPFGIAGSLGSATITSPEGHEVTLKAKRDFVTVGHDQSGKADDGVVFAGYGLSLTEPAYDDYAGLDLKGKTVIVLRGVPRVKDWVKPSELRKALSLSFRIQTAHKRGAAAIVIVNDEATAADDDTPVDLSFLGTGQGKDPIPALVMRRAVVERMLPRGVTLRGLERGIVKSLKPNSFELAGWKARIETQRGPALTRLKNVVGVLEGKGPLADETVVIGAHYDHLGFGNPASSASGSNRRAIHYGADDNASGTAALIELARRFAATPGREGRRIVFAAFSGEEIGLFGSEHYVKDPPYPLKGTTAMYNLDMVGRVKKDSKTGLYRLLTQGHGTAKGFKELLDATAKKHSFSLGMQASGFGPSDHASFCGKKVPVIFAWTGEHAQYHKPTDTADLINVPGVRRIADFSEDVIAALVKMPKPDFIEVKGGDTPRPSKGPRLGIRPGYDPEVDGVEVKGVSPGDPADKAGIKEGDRIVAVAGKPTKDLKAYMSVLAVQKPGTTIDVTVERAGKNVTLKVKLD